MVVSKEAIAKMIDETVVSIISSVDEGGFPNTKAMLPPRKREGLSEFFFTTNTSSMRVRQYRNNPKACLYFFDPGSFRGVMFVGTMEVKTDQATKDMVWREGDTMYYSQGVTDPDYCVLKFSADQMRFYQNFTSVNMDPGVP